MRNILSSCFPLLYVITLVVFLMNYFWTLDEMYQGYDQQQENYLRTLANDEDIPQTTFIQSPRGFNIYGACEYIDATNDYIYLSYNHYSCVDIYDRNGSYYCTLLFPEKQNGCITACCIEDITYICDFSGNVYVYSGIRLEKKLNAVEASENGFDSWWFYDNSALRKRMGNTLYRLNEQGNIIETVSLPTSPTIPLNHFRLLSLIVSLLLFLSSAVVRIWDCLP